MSLAQLQPQLVQVFLSWDNLKKEDNLKNEDDLKYEDDLKKEYDLKTHIWQLLWVHILNIRSHSIIPQAAERAKESQKLIELKFLLFQPERELGGAPPGGVHAPPGHHQAGDGVCQAVWLGDGEGGED